jgi:hypothetical protein
LADGGDDPVADGVLGGVVCLGGEVVDSHGEVGGGPLFDGDAAFGGLAVFEG